MLIIKIDDEVLTFDIAQAKWIGSDEELSSVLKAQLPDNFGSPQMVFSELGLEGSVLEELKRNWPQLKVVVFEPEPDEPGVIY